MPTPEGTSSGGGGESSSGQSSGASVPFSSLMPPPSVGPSSDRRIPAVGQAYPSREPVACRRAGTVAARPAPGEVPHLGQPALGGPAPRVDPVVPAPVLALLLVAAAQPRGGHRGLRVPRPTDRAVRTSG